MSTSYGKAMQDKRPLISVLRMTPGKRLIPGTSNGLQLRCRGRSDPENPGLKQAKRKHVKLLRRMNFEFYPRARIPKCCYQRLSPPKSTSARLTLPAHL